LSTTVLTNIKAVSYPYRSNVGSPKPIILRVH
jgi:hypothetical protein